MAVTIFWIDTEKSGRIGIMARPRGGDWLEDEVHSLRDAGAHVVVSLLEQQEISELELDQEQSLCEAHGLRYTSFPIPDRSVPLSKQAAGKLIEQLAELVSARNNIVIHCRQGIGRSAIIAASLLANQGVSVEEAFEQITNARGRPVPDTPQQREWVAEFVSEKRPGRLGWRSL